MGLYNILSCGGFERTGTSYVTGGGCMTGRLGLVVLFFLIAIMRKWLGEEMGIAFNFLLSLVVGLGGYLVVITIVGLTKWAFLAGLVGSIAGGMLGGLLFGGGDDE